MPSLKSCPNAKGNGHLAGGRHFSRRLRVTVALAVGVFMLAASGCQADECEGGQMRCAGAAAAERCEDDCSDLGCHYRWMPAEQCNSSQICIQPAEQAFCAASADKDPRCAGGSTSFYCDGDTIVTCWDGYRIDSAPCGKSLGYTGLTSTGTRCVSDVQQGAACVPSDAVLNPQCGDADARHCEGDALVRCIAGYEVARMLCRKCDLTVSRCPGFLGDNCSSDIDCASGMSCRNVRCTAACEVDAGIAPEPADAGDAARVDAIGTDAAPAAPVTFDTCSAAFSGGGPFHPRLLEIGLNGFMCVAGLCVW
jgi:hypothetical protein